MPTTVELFREDGSMKECDLLWPGGNIALTTDNVKNSLGRVVMISCKPDDRSAEIFECTPTEGIPDEGKAKYFDSLRNDDNFTLRVHDQFPRTLYLHDIDDGALTLVVTHSIQLSPD